MMRRAIGWAAILGSTVLLSSACQSRDHPLRDRIKAARAARAAQNAPPPAASDSVTTTLDFEGIAREYMLQAPNVAKARVPVVVVLHGATRSAADIFDRTSWPQIAKRENFLLVAPNGINGQWNDGRGDTISGKNSDANDVGFLTALIEKLVRDNNADPSAVFVTGVSNGGMMTIRYSCERTPRLAAVAPVIAAMPVALEALCRKAGPVPALFIPGTADPVITYDGKPSALTARRGPTPPMLSIPSTIDLWRDRNGCGAPLNSFDLPNRDRNDQSTVTRIAYHPCKSGSPLVMLRVNGGGHQQPAIPRAANPGPLARILGPQNGDIDGPEEIWRFFAAQLRR
jgi:polyhydroxybutyrate depolymerase